MKKFHGEITNSIIAKNAIINDYSTIINSEISSHCSIGKFSFIAYSKLGKYSYASQNTIIKTTNIGNFTSISWGVSIGPEEHDYNKLTNHSFLCSTKMFNLSKNKFYNPFEKNCEIGNDVWIGCNSTILRGLKVGDGAIIGANSLVNKDVPPYAIVVGSPAKIIKFRFSQKIINELVQIKWWDLSDDFIKENIYLFNNKPTIKTIKMLKKLIQDEKEI